MTPSSPRLPRLPPAALGACLAAMVVPAVADTQPPPGDGTNQPPIARCDSYRVKPGETLRVRAETNVIANDSDVDGHKLTAVPDSTTFARRRLDFDGATGRFTFTAPRTRRSARFRYYLRDSQGGVSQSTSVHIGVGRRPTRPGCPGVITAPDLAKLRTHGYDDDLPEGERSIPGTRKKAVRALLGKPEKTFVKRDTGSKRMPCDVYSRPDSTAPPESRYVLLCYDKKERLSILSENYSPSAS